MPRPLRALVASVTIGALAPLSIAALGAITPAQADPQVCTTSRVPTAETAPWLKFAQAKNPMTASIPAFKAADLNARALLSAIDAESTEAELLPAMLATLRLQLAVQSTMMAPDAEFLIAYFEVSALTGIGLGGDPDAELPPELVPFAQAMEALEDFSGELTGEDSAFNVYMGRVNAFATNQTSETPEPGVLYPSAAGVIADLEQLELLFERAFAAARANVVWSATPVRTCVTTATVKVPGATVAFGAKRSVSISTSREGKPLKGNMLVLLDGKRIANATQASSYSVALPTNMAAGKHILTVAFVPADGGPYAANSSTIVVTKAKTATKVKLAKKTIKRGAKATAKVSVTVPGSTATATGKVKITVGKKSFNGTLRKGVATVKLKNLPAGKHKVKATFRGTGSLVASSGTAKLTVR